MADNDSITTNQAPTDRPEFNASDINNAANDGPPDFHRNIQPIYEEEGEQPHLSQTDFSEKEANQNTAQNPVNDSNSVDTNAPVNNTDSSKKMSIGDALGRVSKDKDLQKKSEKPSTRKAPTMRLKQKRWMPQLISYKRPPLKEQR